MPTVPELLEFERAHPRNDGRKEEAVRLRFGMGFPRYHQILRVVLLDVHSPEHREALSIDAQFVHQLEDRWRKSARDRRRRIGMAA